MVAENAILDCIFPPEYDARVTASGASLGRCTLDAATPRRSQVWDGRGQAPVLLPAPVAKRPCVTPSQAPQRAIPAQAKPATKAAPLVKSVPASP